MRQRILYAPYRAIVSMYRPLLVLSILFLVLPKAVLIGQTTPIQTEVFILEDGTEVEMNVYNNTRTHAKTQESNDRSTTPPGCNIYSEIEGRNLSQGGNPLDEVGCQNNDSLQICFTVYQFNGADNGCQYLHGLVPDFGDCLNVFPLPGGEPSQITSPMTNVSGNGIWQWFPEDVVLYNNIPGGYYPPGTPVGAGWFYIFHPGNDPTCTDYTNPNCTWGDGSGCSSGGAWDICFIAEPICTDPGIELCEISFRTFGDGETGGWDVLGCETDEPITYEFELNCCQEPIILNDETEFSVCSGDLFTLDLISDMDPETTYDWIALSNPHGATSGSGTTISDILINTTGSPVTVTYIVTPTCAQGCIGEKLTVTVTIFPEVEVIITGNTLICEGDCAVLTAQVISDSPYQSCVWGQGVGQSNVETVVVCPTFSTEYFVTVTDINGCIGVASIFVEVLPIIYVDIVASTTQACENGSDYPITLTAIAFGGSGDYIYNWNNGATGPEITVTESGNYFVEVVDPWSGCFPAFADINVEVFPASEVIVTGPDQACSNDGVICFAGTPLGGVWGGVANSSGCVDPQILGSGIHTLDYSYTDANGCESTTYYTLQIDEAPGVPESLSDQLLCDDNLIQSYSIADIPFANTIEWTLNGSGTITAGQGTNTIEVAWSYPGGDICVSGQNACGSGSESCFFVEITERPIASFTMAPSACINEFISVDFDGYAGPNAIFDWNLDGGSVIDGDPSSGNFVLQWLSTGSYTVTLFVSENDCIASYSQTIDIEEWSEILDVQCISTSTSSVEFYWDPVPGAAGYAVNGIDQSNTNYIVNNLAPGETVSVTVEAWSDNPLCGIIADYASCTSLDCQLMDLQLTDISARCSDDPVVLCNANIPGGTWSGSGITDAIQGVFDPSVAAIGLNTINYTVSDGNCSASQTMTIEVFEPLLSPEISYTSTSNSVSFTWNPVVGASSYLVNGVEQFATTFEFTNLAPGETVNLSVEAISAGPCDNSFAQISFTAEECPVVDIQLGNINAQCQDNTSLIALTTNVSGGTWSGNGIVDALTGTFRPASANLGMNTITYTIVNGQCTDTKTLAIEVLEPLAVPIINCNSTQSSVSFTWSPVAGASSYLVNGVEQFSTTFELTNLSPGETIDVSVEAVGNGPCGSSFAQASCAAEECPVVDIQLGNIDAQCQDNNSLIALTTNMSGGTWSGSGIVDALTGTFRPASANLGMNTITYTIVNGQCTDTKTLAIEVLEPLAVPIINCNSTQSSVSFTWNPVAGASSYVVNGVEQFSTTFELTNLSPGETVDVSVEAVGNGPCGNSSAQSTCTTTACSPIVLLIEAPQNICRNTGSTTEYPVEVNVQGGNGNGLITWSGAGIVDPANGIFNPEAIGIIEGMNEVVCTYKEGSCTYTERVLINVEETPIVDAGETETLTCNNEVLTLNGQGDGTAAWDGPGILSGEETKTPIINAPGVYTLTITNSNASCSATDVIEVLENKTKPVAVAGADQVLTCSAPDCQLTSVGNTDTNLIPQWNGPGINTGNENLPTPTVNVSGEYVLTILNTENGCVSDPVLVMVSENIQEPLGDIIVNGALDCSGGSVILETVNQAGVTYEWTTPIGTTHNDFVLETVLAGVYTLEATNQTNGCTTTSEVLIEDLTNALTVEAGTDQEITCQQPKVTLDGTGTVTGTNIEYLWTGPAGGIIGPADALQVEVSLGGMYILKVRNNSNACINQDTVYVAEDTTAPIVEAGADQQFNCNDQQLSLNATSTSDADSYVWVNENEEVIAISLATEIETPGWYTLEATNAENGCVGSDSVYISVNENIPYEITVNTRATTCHGDRDGAIEIQGVLGGLAPYQYALDGQSFSENANWEFLESGTYDLIVEDAAGCYFEETIFVPDAPVFEIDLGADMVMELGQSHAVVLDQIDASRVDDVYWTPEEAVTCLDNDCLEVLLSPMNTTEIEVLLVDTAGCEAKDELQLRVKKNRGVFIPNIFTPNGDEINDRFYIQGLSKVKQVNRMIVMDRWGGIVFENTNFNINDPLEGWDGTLNGERMNPAVFVYLAEVEFIDGYIGTFKGDVTLVR